MLEGVVGAYSHSWKFSHIQFLNQGHFYTFAGSKTKTVNMNNYETVFILNPVLSEDQAKDTVEKFVKVLKKANAEILNNEQWGLKKIGLSYQQEVNWLLQSHRICGRIQRYRHTRN